MKTLIVEDDATCRCWLRGLVTKLGFTVVATAVRQLIARNATSLGIQSAALKQGYRPMWHDGLKKALRGLTTLEEVEHASAQAD